MSSLPAAVLAIAKSLVSTGEHSQPTRGAGAVPTSSEQEGQNAGEHRDHVDWSPFVACLPPGSGRLILPPLGPPEAATGKRAVDDQHVSYSFFLPAREAPALRVLIRPRI
jgi:hypothetical protein